LKDWFELLTSNDNCHLDLISTFNCVQLIFITDFHLVYLRAKPETCLERIKTRNRPEEQSITLDYLKQLHDCHEQWLALRTYPCSIPVLIIDADQTQEHVYSDTNTHLQNLVTC